MNSWISIELAAWAPPLRTLRQGTGSTRAEGPPRYLYRGRSALAAAALATAIETARIALAPRFALFVVASASFIARSISSCLVASRPTMTGAMVSTTLLTALVTPFPPKRSPPSRNSTASWVPVEAPDGTMARPKPPFVKTSASTVGLPRESRT